MLHEATDVLMKNIHTEAEALCGLGIIKRTVHGFIYNIEMLLH
jgi:hypothetical protein